MRRASNDTGWAWGFIAALLLGISGLGCDTSVNPVIESGRAFTFYGVLTPQADVQKVVVYPIADRLAPLTEEPLDATVKMEDLTADLSYTLQDSAFQESDGRWAHAFIWKGRAAYGHTYRITAENSKGESTSVTVPVPPNANLEPQEPITDGPLTLPVHVTAPVPRLMHVEMAYRIQYRPGPVSETTTTLYVDYDSKPRQLEDGTWRIPIRLSEDLNKLEQWCDRNNCWPQRGYWGIMPLRISLRLAAVNEAWNPPGSEFVEGAHRTPAAAPSFDPEALVQAGTFSNVEDGFGFVGGGYRRSLCWTPEGRQGLGCRTLSNALLLRAGFRLTQ